MENNQINKIELDELFPKNIQAMIQPKYSLLKEINESKAKNIIVQLVKLIPNFQNKLKDLELILMICLYIENLKIVDSKNKKKKINKEALFVSICHELFNISPESQDMEDLKSSAQFLLDHKKVEKFNLLKKFYLSLKVCLVK